MALVVAPYLAAPVYRFAAPSPFAGTDWYNPYREWTGPGLRTNLHAHSAAWGGLTHGHDAPDAVRAAYARRGYDVASLSNYHAIESEGGGPVTVPTYEHGINVFKSHRLAIGASRVDWFDLPLGQTAHHKQYVIDRLHADAELVAIVHPALRGGHSPADLAALTGYELLEVLNHFGRATGHWDAALSAGHPVWAIGNDDTHDVTDAGQTGVMWTQVGAQTRDRAGVIDALRAGRHVAVAAPRGMADAVLEQVRVDGDSLHVRVAGPVYRILAIGDGGMAFDSATATGTASFRLPSQVTYVRLEVSTPAATLYLNPIIRGDGSLPVVAPATLDVTATVAQRAVALGVLGWLVAGTGPSRRAGAGRRWRPRPRRVMLRLRLRLAGRPRLGFRRRRAGIADAALPPG